jgi:hypothetical protein
MTSIYEKFAENRTIIEEFRASIDRIDLECIKVVTQTKINENRISDIGAYSQSLESQIIQQRIDIQNIRDKELDWIKQAALNAENQISHISQKIC